MATSLVRLYHSGPAFLTPLPPSPTPSPPSLRPPHPPSAPFPFQPRLQRSYSEDPASQQRCSSSQSHRGSKAKNRHLNLEEALKEKDREIQNLRETMEKNEKVIVDVYNDKQRWWQEEMNTIMKDHNVSLAYSSSP